MPLVLGKTAYFLAEFIGSILPMELHLDGFCGGRYFRTQLKHRIEQSRSSATAFLLIEKCRVTITILTG
jgi:hypothetical protein